MITSLNGELFRSQEIIELCKKLIGTKVETIKGIDITVVRKVKSLTREQGLHLTDL